MAKKETRAWVARDSQSGKFVGSGPYPKDLRLKILSQDVLTQTGRSLVKHGELRVNEVAAKESSSK